MDFSLILNIDVKFRAFGIDFGSSRNSVDLAKYLPGTQPLLAVMLEEGVVSKVLGSDTSKVVAHWSGNGIVFSLVLAKK